VRKDFYFPARTHGAPGPVLGWRTLPRLSVILTVQLYPTQVSQHIGTQERAGATLFDKTRATLISSQQQKLRKGAPTPSAVGACSSSHLIVRAMRTSVMQYTTLFSRGLLYNLNGLNLSRKLSPARRLTSSLHLLARWLETRERSIWSNL